MVDDGTKGLKDQLSRGVGWAAMALAVFVFWQSCTDKEPDRCEQTAKAGLDAHDAGDTDLFNFYYDAAKRLGCL